MILIRLSDFAYIYSMNLDDIECVYIFWSTYVVVVVVVVVVIEYLLFIIDKH